MASETRQGRHSRTPVGVLKLLILVLAGLLLWRGDTAGFVSGDAGSAGAICYTLTLNVGSGSGTVLAMPGSSGSCPSGQYTAGYTVAVVATPGGGYVFSGWSGTDNDNNSSTTVTMSGDRTATAYFTSNCYQLTLNVGGGSGTVQAMPTSSGGCPAGQYSAGYTVAVVATPNSGYQWSSWSGTDNDSNSSTTVTMTGNRTATAYFTSTCYQLTLTVGGGNGTVLAMPGSSGGCPQGRYTAGYVVAVLATPGSGSQFSSWSGTDNNGNSSTTVTMNSDRTATAYFTSTCYQLTLNVGGGNGTVLAMPGSSGGCPTGRYTAGYVVAVLATPGSGSQFSSWSGTDNNSNSSTTVTMNSDRTATAYFTSNCYQLTLNVGGGSGTVLAMPGSAGGCPNGQYPAGYVVAVVATPGSGSQFSSWSGTDNNSNSSTTVTMTGNRTATAYFTSNCYLLTLTVGGGNGTVLAMPGSAGGCPNGQYNGGYAVAVLATPGSGYQFSSWSGTDNNGNSSTTVTMTGNRTATAYFAAQGATPPPTPTATPTHTPTATWSPTPTATPTATSTSSAPATPTNTPAAPPTPTATSTHTPTATWSPTPTSTPPAPGTPTDTPPPASETDTPAAPPTPTAAPTATPTPTWPPTSVPTSTSTPPAAGTPTHTPTPTRTFTPSPTAQGLHGDADCSGRVTAVDAALVLQSGAGLIAHVACPLAADANGDGQVTSVDAALILQFGAGLLSGL